jgi:hypothetical protein
MKQAYPLAVLLALFCTQASAQDNNTNNETEADQQIRDVTPAGPYPIYLHVMPLFEFQNRDFAEGIKHFNQVKSTELNEFSMGFGYKADVGIKFYKRLFLEVGYTRATVNVHQNTDRLIVSNRYFAARVGFAKTIYYPLSIQAYGGFLLGGTQFVIDAADTRSTISFNGRNWWQDRNGIEGGVRLVFADPAGSGGGLGFVIEASYVHFVDRYSYRPYLAFLDPTNTESFASDPNFWTLSIGIVVPIAIKF